MPGESDARGAVPEQTRQRGQRQRGLQKRGPSEEGAVEEGPSRNGPAPDPDADPKRRRPRRQKAPEAEGSRGRRRSRRVGGRARPTGPGPREVGFSPNFTKDEGRFRDPGAPSHVRTWMRCMVLCPPSPFSFLAIPSAPPRSVLGGWPILRDGPWRLAVAAPRPGRSRGGASVLQQAGESVREGAFGRGRSGATG
jgi:hypothetical protein